MSSITEAIALASQSFTGQLLQPADAAYEARRRVHNGLIDKRPAAIASCHGVADVVEAVRLARTLGLEVAVRGGGHNVAGRAAIDQGLMIDVSPMKGIHVAPRAGTARAEGGVLWKEFNRETQLHGLATTGGVVGSTGIAGLTLGGGIGWLMPKYGLALDNLRSATVVMADGRVLEASAGENPDLFWAIRGGGGNFGIAASLDTPCIKSGRRSPAVSSFIRSGGLSMCSASSAIRACHSPTRRCWSLRCRRRRMGRTPGWSASWDAIVDRSSRARRLPAAQGVRPAGDGRARADAVHDAERHDRRRIPERGAQLLESAVPDRLE